MYHNNHHSAYPERGGPQIPDATYMTGGHGLRDDYYNPPSFYHGSEEPRQYQPYRPHGHQDFHRRESDVSFLSPEDRARFRSSIASTVSALSSNDSFRGIDRLVFGLLGTDWQVEMRWPFSRHSVASSAAETSTSEWEEIELWDRDHVRRHRHRAQQGLNGQWRQSQSSIHSFERGSSNQQLPPLNQRVTELSDDSEDDLPLPELSAQPSSHRSRSQRDLHSSQRRVQKKSRQQRHSRPQGGSTRSSEPRASNRDLSPLAEASEDDIERGLGSAHRGCASVIVRHPVIATFTAIVVIAMPIIVTVSVVNSH